VDARRTPRAPRDPDLERQRIDERSLEVWVDEGSTAIRQEATGAAQRARTAGAPTARTPSRRARGGVDPSTAAEIRSASPDTQHGTRAVERLAAAAEALERDRIDEARRLVGPLTRQIPSVAAVHRIAGLVAYRGGRWRQAVIELEAAEAIAPSLEHLPVLADAYRALRRWSDVERIWTAVRAASPSHEIMAEARIVAAGALADRGDLAGAVRTLAPAASSPKRIRDHHLRQWYVLGDLHDRSGDPIEATRWFERIAAHDPEFVDVRQRLHALGR